MIVLMSDFGTADGYVAAMKGVIASVAPGESIVDATHEIPPQDIAAGAWALANYTPYYPEGTIHVAVVDPGVGTGRSLVMVEGGGQCIFAPDNGLLSIWLSSLSGFRARKLKHGWHRPGFFSATFHGRDILAYAAGLKATGKLEEANLEEMDYPLMRLPESVVNLKQNAIHGRVIHIDRFGNAITGITRSHLERYKRKRPKIFLPFGTAIPLKNTYGDVAAGKTLALINSSDHLEVAIHAGNASLTHGLSRNAEVRVEF
ncbi:MAG TPA: SAM-dependent chlorinase/fluorinase [Kiritimatiellia bacterium]|nr:SAM-dependent chlorinase/fluorinase [Kiritimatiellia bacterium]